MKVLVVALAAPAARLEGSLWSWGEGGREPLPASASATAAPAVTSAPSLLDQITQAIASGHERVVIGLGALDTMDTDEVKQLTDFLWSIRVEGGDPVVVSPVHDVMQALLALKLDRAFPVHRDLAEAVRSPD